MVYEIKQSLKKKEIQLNLHLDVPLVQIFLLHNAHFGSRFSMIQKSTKVNQKDDIAVGIGFIKYGTNLARS